MIKLSITKISQDWLEATWTEEVITTSIVENEVEETVHNTETTILHCESFSGHPEHIAMLEAKALEFGTSLDEFEGLIAQVKDAFVMPTAEELAKEELDQKIQEANGYLAQTDWVNTYKIRHDLGLELIPEDSSKWEVINQREEYIVFLKAIEGAK